VNYIFLYIFPDLISIFLLYLKHKKCTGKITRTVKHISIPSSFCALNFMLPACRLKHEVARSTQSLSRPGVVGAYKGLTVHWYCVASASHDLIAYWSENACALIRKYSLIC